MQNKIESLKERLEQLTGKKVLLEKGTKGSDKIKRDAFLYMDPKGPKEEFAQCSTCANWTGETCMILGKDVKVTADMTCGLYVHGEPNSDGKGQEEKLISSEEAGLVKRQVRCENCASFDGKEKCLLFEALNKSMSDHFKLDTKVNKLGCCNAQKEKE